MIVVVVQPPLSLSPNPPGFLFLTHPLNAQLPVPRGEGGEKRAEAVFLSSLYLRSQHPSRPEQRSGSGESRERPGDSVLPERGLACGTSAPGGAAGLAGRGRCFKPTSASLHGGGALFSLPVPQFPHWRRGGSHTSLLDLLQGVNKQGGVRTGAWYPESTQRVAAGIDGFVHPVTHLVFQWGHREP